MNGSKIPSNRIFRRKNNLLIKNEGKGYDGGKKVAGRKSHIVVDTLGYPMNIRLSYEYRCPQRNPS
ncbi:transposase [Candidatus Sarmatiella mevalonica]|uniref:transposase n=1 Tax=Candidatus Sarmatiella mevalonica TaxID=2770581 RepID=UPI003977A385